MTREVHVVVPAGIDDLAVAQRGQPLRPARRAGPGRDRLDGARARGRRRLAASGRRRPRRAGVPPSPRVPDGAVVLVDGLVACGVPEVVVPAARRLALVVLVHLPLGDESGAPPELAAREREVLASRPRSWSPPAPGRRAGSSPGTGWTRPGSRSRRPGVDPAPRAPGRGRHGPAVRRRAHPDQGPGPAGRALAEVRDLPWTCTLVGPLRDPGYVDGVRDAMRAARARRPRAPHRPARPARRSTRPTRRADLLVVPSRAETYGMVVTEALARGIPVLASDAGGLPETLGRDPEGRVPGVVVAVGRRRGARRRTARLVDRLRPAGGAPARARTSAGACCTGGR